MDIKIMKRTHEYNQPQVGLFDTPSYLLFDFETTGLKLPQAVPVQLAYITLNETFQILQAKNFYFQVKDEIPDSATKIHGLTKQKLLSLGAKPLEMYQKEIETDFITKGLLAIAHNAPFDAQFLHQYFVFTQRVDAWCTMKYYTPIIRLPGSYDKYKWPRVSETMDYLHIDESEALLSCQTLFGNGSIGYHDARFDIVCILKMIQRDATLKEALQKK